jgi:hypothetical protein
MDGTGQLYQVTEKWPSVPRFAGLSGRLTVSAAWQEVAPYSSRRHSQDFACLREAASAKAGGPSQGRDFAELNLHLPACRSLDVGRALFEQPEKDDFFIRLLEVFYAVLSLLPPSYRN